MPMTPPPHGGVPDPDAVSPSIADIPALNAITESGECINCGAFVDGTTRGRRWGWKSPGCIVLSLSSCVIVREGRERKISGATWREEWLEMAGREEDHVEI